MPSTLNLRSAVSGLSNSFLIASATVRKSSCSRRKDAPVVTVLVLRQLSFLFVFYTNNPQFVVSSLTHRHEAPHNGWRSEAGKDVVCVGEVREVWQDNGLAPALTPHKNLEEE